MKGTRQICGEFESNPKSIAGGSYAVPVRVVHRAITARSPKQNYARLPSYLGPASHFKFSFVSPAPTSKEGTVDVKSLVPPDLMEEQDKQGSG